jgi:hypothetical protein
MKPISKGDIGSPCSALSAASGSRVRLTGSFTAKVTSTDVIYLFGATLSLSATPSLMLETAPNVSVSRNGPLLSGCINSQTGLGGCSTSRNTCRKTSRSLIVLRQSDVHMALHAAWYSSRTDTCGHTFKIITLSTCPTQGGSVDSIRRANRILQE